MKKYSKSICVVCSKIYTNKKWLSKYCSEECKKIVRSRVQKKCRHARNERSKNDLDYCSLEAYKKYKYRSPQRGLEFMLTVKHFRDNIEKPCYYCGDDYEGIGFDRVDNIKGYYLSNVVPCCVICNNMKHTYSQKDFINRCVMITKNYFTNSIRKVEF